jgi:ferredoxin, 2Fe-2S
MTSGLDTRPPSERDGADGADPRLVVIDRDGDQRELEWSAGQASLMELLRDNDLPILASCGGTASCATCHVYLEPAIVAQLGERGDDERELLEECAAFDGRSSRLSCQITRTRLLDGGTVTLAPEEDE